MPTGLDPETIGPVDVALIVFEGNDFTGDVAPALAELHDSGTVRVIDLAFVRKEADGTTSSIEVGDADVADEFERVNNTEFDLLSDEDLTELSSGFPVRTCCEPSRLWTRNRMEKCLDDVWDAQDSWEPWPARQWLPARPRLSAEACTRSPRRTPHINEKRPPHSNRRQQHNSRQWSTRLPTKRPHRFRHSRRPLRPRPPRRIGWPRSENSDR